jgi:hypothetical protein
MRDRVQRHASLSTSCSLPIATELDHWQPAAIEASQSCCHRGRMHLKAAAGGPLKADVDGGRGGGPGLAPW